jgi:hypothetical protein
VKDELREPVLDLPPERDREPDVVKLTEPQAVLLMLPLWVAEREALLLRVELWL